MCVTPVFTVGDIQLDNPLQTTDIKVILGGVIGKILAVLGSITLLVFIQGGFTWLISAGNAEKVQAGTKTMLYAIIGLFVIFASYAIINMLLGGITGTGTSGGGAGGGGPENTIVSEEKQAVTPGGSNNPVGDSCGGAEHPSWSCRDINNCDIPLGTENNVTKQRAICKATSSSCLLGKCDGGESKVCCAEAPKGSCIFSGWTICKESTVSLIMNKHNCDALEGSFSTATCASRANEIKQNVIK